MRLRSDSFEDGMPIPTEYAFCVPDPSGGVGLGPNRNPAFSWTEVPEGTKSLVLICHDVDAPTRQEVEAAGESVPAELPRTGFFHWVLVDLDPALPGLHAGEWSDGVTGGGKDPGGLGMARQGVNDYTIWFDGDAGMEGVYFGYDGPCPPATDSIVHRYIFTLYALDVARCPTEGEFRGSDVLSAIDGHVLDQASITGTYALNPSLRN